MAKRSAADMDKAVGLVNSPFRVIREEHSELESDMKSHSPLKDTKLPAAESDMQAMEEVLDKTNEVSIDSGRGQDALGDGDADKGDVSVGSALTHIRRASAASSGSNENNLTADPDLVEIGDKLLLLGGGDEDGEGGEEEDEKVRCLKRRVEQLPNLIDSHFASPAERGPLGARPGRGPVRAVALPSPGSGHIF